MLALWPPLSVTEIVTVCSPNESLRAGVKLSLYKPSPTSLRANLSLLTPSRRSLTLDLPILSSGASALFRLS